MRRVICAFPTATIVGLRDGELANVNLKMTLAFLLGLTLSVALASGVATVDASSASVVRILSPTNAAAYSSRFLVLNVTFDCGGLKYNLTYTLDGQYEGAIPYNIINPAEFHIVQEAVGQVMLPELSDGLHSITVTLVVSVHYGGGGKPGAPFQPMSPGSSEYVATWTDTVHFTVASDEPYTPQPQQPVPVVDSTPPEISALALDNQTYVSPDVPLNFTLNENASRIAYSLDGAGNVTIAGNSTLAGLSSGWHNVTLYAWDVVGNVGASNAVNFYVSQPASEPDNFLTALVVAPPLAVVAAFVVGLVVYSNKRKTLDKPS
jgi:hypothetical protein